MHKTLLFRGVIVILLGSSLYLSHQYYLDAQNSKDQRIESLLAEIAWKDQIIADLNSQLKNIDSPASEAASVQSFVAPALVTDEKTGNRYDTQHAANPQTQQSQEIDLLAENLERQTSILRNLSRLKPFSRINLADDQLASYFDRMTEITEQNLYQSEYMVNPDNYGQVRFDNSDYIPDQSKNSFGRDRKKLYAHFDLPDYPYQSVLIKWYQQGVSDPIELSYFDINPNSSENYAWIEPKSNWDEGRYFVEIYSASESAELLSAGSYVVEQ